MTTIGDFGIAFDVSADNSEPVALKLYADIEGTSRDMPTVFTVAICRRTNRPRIFVSHTVAQTPTSDQQIPGNWNIRCNSTHNKSTRNETECGTLPNWWTTKCDTWSLASKGSYAAQTRSPIIGQQLAWPQDLSRSYP